MKNRYIGRTFIEPTKALRRQGVALKFSPLKETLEGARIVLVDDSIVRGTTTAPIVALCRNAGAKEFTSESPRRGFCTPATWASTWRPSRPRRGGARTCEIAAMVARFARVPQPGGLSRAIGVEGLCRACFDGNYHIPVDESFTKDCFEGFGRGLYTVLLVGSGGGSTRSGGDCGGA